MLQKFHSLPTPKHHPKDIRNFLTEYRTVKTQLRHAVDFDQAELVIKSTLVRKLAFQTFDKICNLYVTHDLTHKQMETGIQHIIDKLEQGALALGEKANVKPVGVSSQQTNQQTNRQPNQQNRNSNQECSYCSGSHFTNECTKYKTVNARKDRVMALRLCFNCLKPGHSSKTCSSNRTCRTCGLHHHSSLCIKASSSNSSNRESSNLSTNSNANSTVVSQGKSNPSSNSTSSSTHCSSNTTSRTITHPQTHCYTKRKQYESTE